MKYIYRDSLIKTVKIDVSEEFEAEEGQEVYLVLRELPTGDMLKLTEYQNDVPAMVGYFIQVFPQILKEHNIYVDENTLMSTERLTGLLKDKFQLAFKVVNSYCKSSFFIPKGKTEER